MELKDERAFTPEFLASCSDLELVVLQHDLRICNEDRPYLNQVLAELGKRHKPAPAAREEER